MRHDLHSLALGQAIQEGDTFSSHLRQHDTISFLFDIQYAGAGPCWLQPNTDVSGLIYK
jgi:hypothetical protein